MTDRYTKAIEQLGSEKLDVRIGGIYALERVARDSPRDHPTVMEVLAAFTREHSREQTPLPESDDAPAPEGTTQPDVQAALTVIGRRDAAHDRQPIDLADTHLARANLTDADLTDADLTGAILTGAILIQAHLASAHLTGADLADAHLARADLTGADLTSADLSGAGLTQAHLADAGLADAHLADAHLASADLTGADLADADLKGADLTDADLTGADLTGADLSRALWLQESPAPEGWVRDPGSGRLRRAGSDADDIGN